MLTYHELVDLYRQATTEPVLSVYLDVDQHDPAERETWRTRLEGLIGTCRRDIKTDDGGSADGSTPDQDGFEAAWNHLSGRLGEYDSFVPGRGWVGFATPDRLYYTDELPVPVPDLVRWEMGIRVAPYLRVLERARPVVAVLADRERARLFEFRNGTEKEPLDLRADTFIGDLSDVGVSKRSSRTTGTRGETATDQAQRILEVGTERMTKEVVKTLADFAGNNGVIVLGGTPEMVSRLGEALPKSLRTRACQDPSMHLDMSIAEVREFVERDVSQLNQQRQEALLEQVTDRARAGGRAALGLEETERALSDLSVDTLLLSRTFIARNPDLADHLLGSAFLQGAEGEELGDTAGERLDQEGEGVAARLRFRGQPKE